MELSFLQDLTVVLLIAGVVTVFCHHFRQPVILGYILAGVIIGPHTPPFQLVASPASIQTMSQLGVVMLMFNLGLQFSLRGMRKVGSSAVVAGIIEILLMIWVGYQVGRLFGWNQMDSIFLGAMLLSSSTVIIVKTLNDLNMSAEPFAKLLFGILVLDDVVAILAIAALSGIALSGSFSLMEVAHTGGRIGLFFVAVVVLGLLTMPRLLRFVCAFKNNEVLLIVVLGIGFGTSLLAVRLGFSTALGAFLIGAVISETREGGRIRALIEPVRDMFSAVFFVSIGLLLDPDMVVGSWRPVLVVTLVLIVGKAVTGSLGSLVAGHPLRTSLRVGMGLAQIGEFAFIIAALGQNLGVTSDFLYPVGVSVSAVTMLSTPFLIRSSDHLASRIESLMPASVRGYLDFYWRWLSGLSRQHKHPNQVRGLLRRWSLQIALNVALITVFFISASALSSWFDRGPTLIPRWAGGKEALLLFAALLSSLPLLLATLRKLRASAMLLAEASIHGPNKQHVATLRSLATKTIVGIGAALLTLYLLLIGSVILPSWPVIIILFLLSAAIIVWRWQSLNKLYASAQVAIRDTLAEHHAPVPIEVVTPALLRHTVMEVVSLPESSPAVGRLIRQLELRTRTGASVVMIERQDQRIINPSPDEELRAGDAVLVIGGRDQVGQARRILTQPESL